MAFGQVGEMFFTHFQTEDGLPSREVYCMTQDSIGYYWFGTDNGVSRFDGYEFKSYQIGNNYEVNVFNSIKIKKNRLWFGSMFHGAYYFEKEHLYSYKYNHLLTKYKGKYTTSILEYISNDDDFYFSLFNFGIIKIDKSGNITEFKNSSGYGYITIEVDKTIFGTRSIDLKDIRELSKRTATFEFNGNRKYNFNLKSKNVQNEKTFHQQRIKNGFFFYLNQLKIITEQKSESCRINERVNTMFIGEDEKIYLGFGDSKGIAIVENLESLKKGKYKSYLKNNNVSSIFLDKNKNLWVTTTNNGVFYCKSPMQMIYNYFTPQNESYVSTVEPISENECYFGTSNGNVFHLKNSLIKKIQNYPHEVFYCDELVFNKSNEKLYSYGSYYKNEKWHVIKSNFTNGNHMFKNFFLDTFTQNVWFANHRDFGFFDKNDKPTKFLGIRENEFIRIFDILYQNDTLWLASQNGLYASYKGTGPCLSIIASTLNERINCMTGDNKNNVYLGTKESGIVIRKPNNQCIKINKTNGLSTNNIKNVFVDKHGVLWVCSNMGLDKITFDSLGKYKIRNINIAHGLPSNEVYQVKSANQQLWLATGKGLVKFYEKPINKVSQKPVITSISISNKNIAPTSNFQLTYQTNNILIRYRTINPLLESKIKYRYKFSNSANWIYTTSTSLEFVELQSGIYNLSIQSANEDNIWSQSSMLNFSVAAPWWKLWEVYFILAALATLFFYFYQKKQTLRLTKEANLRLELNRLEKLALQNQMNPHFLSNSFTSLQYLINTNKIEQADEYLSDLSRLLRKILDGSRSNEVSLRQEVELIKLYIQLEKIRFENKFNYNIEIHPSIDLDSEKLPPMLIQPIIENAINHAFTDPSQKINNIFVQFSQDDKYIYCSIKDNGVGLSKSLKQKTHDGSRKSYALEIIKDRIINYNQTNKIKIEILFIDNTLSQSENGTSVKFSFPRYL